MKHHRQMCYNVPSMEKLRGVAGKRTPVTPAEQAIADIAPTEWRGIAEAGDPAVWRSNRVISETWRGRLYRLLQRARVSLAAWFRRRFG